MLRDYQNVTSDLVLAREEMGSEADVLRGTAAAVRGRGPEAAGGTDPGPVLVEVVAHHLAL